MTWIVWIVAIVGLVLIGVLAAAQLVAVVSPRSQWTIDNIYGGDPSTTDAKAYFAINQGYAYADLLAWIPLQVAASIGMLLGYDWGFAFGLAAAVPFVYSAVLIFIWDRDLGFRGKYWVVAWGIWPAYGVVEGGYCVVRLLS